MDRGQWRLLVPDHVTWVLDLVFVGLVTLVTLTAAFVPGLRDSAALFRTLFHVLRPRVRVHRGTVPLERGGRSPRSCDVDR